MLIIKLGGLQIFSNLKQWAFELATLRTTALEHSLIFKFGCQHFVNPPYTFKTFFGLFQTPFFELKLTDLVRLHDNPPTDNNTRKTIRRQDSQKRKTSILEELKNCIVLVKLSDNLNYQSLVINI